MEKSLPDGNAWTFIENCKCCLSVYVDDIQEAGNNENMPKMWASLQKRSDLDDSVSFTDHVRDEQKLFSRLISTNTEVKTEEKKPKDITDWSYDMEGHAQNCVERSCEMAHKTVDQLRKVSTRCLEDHQDNQKI